SERGGPISPIGFHRLIQRVGEAAKMPSPIHPHMLRHACGLSTPMMATTRGRCSTTSGTRTSSTRSGIPKWRRTASKSFGVDRCRRRQGRLGHPLDNLGIRACLALRKYFLYQLDTALGLLGCHRLDAAGVLDLHLPRHQMRADLQVCRGVLLPHLCNGFRTVTLDCAAPCQSRSQATWPPSTYPPFASCFRTLRSVALSIFGRP